MTSNIHDLYRHSRRAAILGILVGIGLGLAKLAGGLFGHSIALVSDSVHSLADAVVSGVVWLALRWSQAPPDREHPYGHTRGEAVAGSNVALLLVLTALGIIGTALATLDEPSPAPEPIALWIAGASVALKEGLYRYNARVARRTGSSAIRSVAWDHRADAFSSLAVFVGVGLEAWGGPPFHAADHIAAVLVGLTLLWAGCRLFWTSLQELLDRQADPEVLNQIRIEAQAVPGVQNVEKLRVRKTGLEYLVDIHVQVDPDMTVKEGHQIAHAVKDRLVGRVVPIKDVLVHIEPSFVIPWSGSR